MANKDKNTAKKPGLLSSLFGGGLSAFLFSITGGLLAMTVMALLADSRHLSIHRVVFGRNQWHV